MWVRPLTSGPTHHFVTIRKTEIPLKHVLNPSLSSPFSFSFLTPKTPIHRSSFSSTTLVLTVAMAAAFAFSSTALSPKRPPSLGFATRFSQFTTSAGAPPFLTRILDSRLPLPSDKIVLKATADSIDFFGFASQNQIPNLDVDDVPMPIVMIDQDADPEATVVLISFGDRLGALIDTIKALKDLGLNVVKGMVATEGPIKQTKLHITVSGSERKVEDPDTLESIRLTIINNLLKYHPESSEKLAMGEAFGIKPPENKPDLDIATHISVKEDGPNRSLLCMETADRSGLLLEVMNFLSDLNLNVESAVIDTVGLVAKNKFHVSYSGAALKKDMAQRLTNSLRYFLRRPLTEDDSY